MRISLAGEADVDRFNKFVASSPTADVLQSFQWGDIKERTGWAPVRLIVEDAGEIKASCSILLRRPIRGLPPIAYAPRGPVLASSDSGLLRPLIEGIREQSGSAFVFWCDPPLGADSAYVQKLEEAGLRTISSEGFGGVQPNTVMVLDLDRPSEEIFNGFKSKWRYNVRLAERKGVEIREGRAEDLPGFYEVLSETAVRDHFGIRSLDYYRLLWEQLEPAGMLKMFLAFYEERLIAGIILFLMGERAVYVYGASSDRDRKVMPNHLIQWHAIRWAAESGLHVYDFRGVSPVRHGEPVEPSLAGLNRFKEGFGASYVEYVGQLELTLRPVWNLAWRMASPPAIALRKRLRPSAAED